MDPGIHGIVHVRLYLIEGLKIDNQMYVPRLIDERGRDHARKNQKYSRNK